MSKDQDGFPDDDLSCDRSQCKKDNCPHNTNADQKDYDGDGEGDSCDLDSDADGDGISDFKPRKENGKYGKIKEDNIAILLTRSMSLIEEGLNFLRSCIVRWWWW